MWKVMDCILKRESKRMRACVGLGGEKRRQERGEERRGGYGADL